MDPHPHIQIGLATLLAAFSILIVGCSPERSKELKSPANADVYHDESGIVLRIYTKYPVTLPFDKDSNYIGRVENRSKRHLSLVNSPISEELVASFSYQTWEDAQRGIVPKLALWDDILAIADVSLAPGQAMEFRSNFVPGTILPRQGRCRLILQTGAESLAYSNWIDLRVEPGASGKSLADVQTQWDPNRTTEFFVVTTPSSKWVCARPLYQHIPSGLDSTRHTTVCPMPEGELPEIVPDPERRQAAIIFRNHPNMTTYYNPLIDYYRSEPWPVGHIAADIHCKPIPIDDRSPLGFPIELFDPKR